MSRRLGKKFLIGFLASMSVILIADGDGIHKINQ